MTIHTAGSSIYSRDFNSHTREGVTNIIIINFVNHKNFNSHTREGVTPGYDERELFKSNFNSHTREGVTLFNLCKKRGIDFNSHTREGVTTLLRYALQTA